MLTKISVYLIVLANHMCYRTINIQDKLDRQFAETLEAMNIPKVQSARRAGNNIRDMIYFS